MLTASQRRRCAEIAEDLDAGNLALWRKAEPTLSPEERGAMWDMRREQIARADGRGKKKPLNTNSDSGVSEPKTRADLDLDFWATDDEPDDDDLPEDDGETGRETRQKICSTCHGTGFDSSGARCSRCRGTGRTPQPPPSVDDVDRDQEDDDEQNEK